VLVSPESSESGISRPTYAPILHLARGGMGEVVLALREEGEFKRLYALKRLLALYRQDDDLRSMFLDEARIAGLIRHPNVVSVLDVGEDDDGPYLVMDYVDGVSVSRLIKKVAKAGRRIPVQVALKVIAETCKGLHAAHELRAIDGTPSPVVHRDVSPQNILIGYDGVARVTDFGVAKVLDHIEQTRGSSLKGKQSYMSPEQLRFEELDRRSDLFSVGIVLFEMLAGRRLYKARDGVHPARRILDEPPPDLGEERSDLPPQLVELSFRLMAKDKQKRPSSALEVADQLDALRVPLDAEHGMIDVGRYVSELFESEKEEQSARVASALEQFSAQGRTAGQLPTGFSAGRRAPTAPSSSSRPSRSTLLKIGVILAAVLVLVGLGIVMGSAFTRPQAQTIDAEEPVQKSALINSALIAGSKSDVEDAGTERDSGITGSDAAPAADGSADVEPVAPSDGASHPRRRWKRRHTSPGAPSKAAHDATSKRRYKLRSW